MKKPEAEETRLSLAQERNLPAEAGQPTLRVRRSPEELVPKVVEAIDVLTEYLGLEVLNPEMAKRMRGARTVSREFVLSLIASADTEQQLQKLGSFDPQRAREVLQARDALRIVGERLKIFERRLSYTIEAEWAEVVASALHTYQMANIVADLPEYATLAPHLDILRKHLGRKNGSSKKKRATKKREGEEKGVE